jgi:hypothetical protein
MREARAKPLDGWMWVHNYFRKQQTCLLKTYAVFALTELMESLIHGGGTITHKKMLQTVDSTSKIDICCKKSIEKTIRKWKKDSVYFVQPLQWKSVEVY